MEKRKENTRKITGKNNVKKEIARLGYKLEHLGFKLTKSTTNKNTEKENHDAVISSV